MEWYAFKGGRIFWNNKKAVDCLKKFKSRPEANKTRLGAKAILWLHRSGNYNLQKQIWPNCKLGKGYTLNEKLRPKAFEIKILSIARELGTTSYTAISRKLNSIGIAASNHKVKAITTSEKFMIAAKIK